MAERARRTALLLVAALGVAALAPPASHAIQAEPSLASARAIELKLGAARAEVAARARTLAGLERIRSAIATDATTVVELTPAELQFEPGPREVVEFVQIKGGQVMPLLVMPRGQAPRATGLIAPGPWAAVQDGMLVIGELVRIEPRPEDVASLGDTALSGLVSVSVAVDLTAELAEAKAEGASLELTTARGVLKVGEITTVDQARDLVDGVRLRASLPRGGAGATAQAKASSTGGGMPAWGWAAIAGGAVLLVGGALALRRHRASPQGARTELTPAPGTAPVGETTGSTPNIKAGTQLGRYQLQSRIGAGGMADVYLASKTGEAGFAKPVAIKVMHRHLARSGVVVDHFLDEARLAARLLHPNIVQIIDLGLDGESYFIAMEYIDGRDLEKLSAGARAQGRKLPISIALAVLRKVCDGLHAAHEAVDDQGQPFGMVHRDVKCANVIISKQGQIKVADFGIAKAAGQVHVTQIGETKGTPTVMAPEQRMGHAVDRRADVYAVAAIAFEILTGAAINLDLAALVQHGVEGWPHLPPPSTLRPELPPELDRIVMQNLGFQPDSRLASCHDLELALGEVVRTHNLHADDKAVASWIAEELVAVPAKAERSVA